MVSRPSEEIVNSENMFREIKTEHMLYQINSSADARKVGNKMKKSIEEITKAIENARNTAYEKKIATDNLKIELSKKNEKMKKLQEEFGRIKRQVETTAKKASDLQVEINQIKTAADTIKNATQNIDEKYLEQSQNDLADLLVKTTAEFEKAESELNAAKKMESIISRKLYDTESEYAKAEENTLNEVEETERMISNVTTTIEHIMTSYNEIGVVSKDLLKEATNTKESQEQTYQTKENHTQQELSNTRIPA